MTTNGTSTPLQARVEGGGTPEMSDWYLRSETGVLRDVLLGPAESFRWLGLENAAWSSLVRDTLRMVQVLVQAMVRHNPIKLFAVITASVWLLALIATVLWIALGNAAIGLVAAATFLIGIQAFSVGLLAEAVRVRRDA